MTNQPVASRIPRIRHWYAKLAYVVVSCVLVYLIAAIPAGAGGPGILRSALAFVLIVLGARLFRGADEDDSPRAWWRTTARVPAGVALGSLFALVALLSVAAYVGLSVSNLPHMDVVDVPGLLANVILAAILAYLYFDSSWRLAHVPSAEAIAAAGNRR
jgi:hypothetical protein